MTTNINEMVMAWENYVFVNMQKAKMFILVRIHLLARSQYNKL